MSHSKRFAQVIFGLVALVLAPAAPARENGESSTPTRTAQVDALFEELGRSDAPGGVAAVVRDGRIVYETAYGMADLERGVAVTPRSVFEIGSVSKQFTAMCVLLLEHDGKLSLDDDIRTHIPEMPEYERPITLRHLLHHTSGIRDIETLIPLVGWHYPSYYSVAQQIELITRQRALNFAPGEQYLYSNSGYLLLAEVVRRVSGKTLREFAEERIFEPLGMQHTVFFDHPTQVIPGRAIPYSNGDDGKPLMNLWFLPFAGPSGLYTNLEDLARWDANFYDNRLGGGAALIERMETAGLLADGEAIDYAAGLVIGEADGRRTIRHGGAWMGYRASMLRYPEERLTVIQLANASTMPVSSGDIARVFLDDEGEAEAGMTGGTEEPEPEPVAVAPEVLATYEGTYWNESEQLLRTIEVRDGALSYVRGGASVTELAAIDAGHFIMVGVDNAVDVVFSAPGDTDAATMTVSAEGEEPLEFVHVEPATGVTLAAYAGSYWSDELERELRLEVDGAAIAIGWADEKRRLPATPIGPDDLLSRQFVPVPWYRQDVRLRLERNGADRVTGLTLSCDMVRGVTFTKLSR